MAVVRGSQTNVHWLVWLVALIGAVLVALGAVNLVRVGVSTPQTAPARKCA
jgi:hypothetical protein